MDSQVDAGQLGSPRGQRSRPDLSRLSDRRRAFSPAPGAWFEANGERIKLLDAVAGADASGKPGEVLDDSLNVACGTGYLRPMKVQRAGRGVMTPGELLRGFPIPKGTILT